MVLVIFIFIEGQESVISAICWRSVVPRLKINLEDGIKVEIKGKLQHTHNNLI